MSTVHAQTLHLGLDGHSEDQRGRTGGSQERETAICQGSWPATARSWRAMHDVWKHFRAGLRTPSG